MKRKRGHKKGKPKATTTITNPVTSANAEGEGQNKEETSALDEFSVGNDKDNSGMEVDTPSSTGTDQQHYNLANINSDGSIDKTAKKSVGRVKVKLRTPKLLDSQPTSSDAPTQSDTEKSSQQHGLEKHRLNAERMEDSANSLPDTKLGVPSIRAGSIKIKSSKVLGLNADKAGKPLSVSTEISHPKERKVPQQNPRYNKHELDTSLTIIRKVMKMDAAEPFNVPVNPEALGIPDYFDIIDTPMDFGTVCSNLEKNDKYMNSEDVYKDVQYIWDNCYKYNNKGDYILDLMRRVKKNFMKYWTAAGLYSEPSKGTKGVENASAEDIVLSDGKVGKGAQLKQKKKKRHGRHHKHDCLCAICVLKRRRKEREREENAQITKGNFGSGGEKHAKEFKQEEPMLVESPGGEDSSSNTDESLGSGGDAAEDKGEVAKMEISEKQFTPSEGKHETVDVDDNDDEDNQDVEEEEEEEEEEQDDEEEEDDEEEIEMDSQKREMDDTLKHGGTLAEKSNVGDTTVLHDEYKTMQQEGQDAVVQQQKKHKDSQDKHQKAKLLESLCIENPKLSSLCGILFPNDSQSVWSGPHSLLHQRNSTRTRTSSIHAAIGTFME